MHVHAIKSKITAPLATLVVVALTITATQVAQAQPPIHGGQSLSSKVAAAYNSPAGVQLRSELASIFADPAVPAAAQALIQSDGPTGKNDLTEFQTDLLKALITETRDPSLVTTRLTGERPTFGQLLEDTSLRLELLRNPAISTLAQAGWQLRNSPQLSADIATVVSNNSVSYTTLTPAATANQGGSAALDTTIGDIAAMRTGQAYTGYESLLAPVLQDPNFPSLLKSQTPLDIAGFLPTSDLIALLVPNDHDPSITDIVKASLEILGGLATVGGLLMTGPIVVAGVTITATGLFIFAGISATIIGIIDLATALDCDHDGDPWDPADAPGQEC